MAVKFLFILNRICRVVFLAVPAFLLLLPAVSYSHNPDYHLYNENNGLPRSYINDIYKDRDGFYWFATEKGIVRFDGLNFVAINDRVDDPAAISVSLFHPYRDRLYFAGADKDAFYLDLKDYSIVRFYQGPIADVFPLGTDRYCVLTNRGLLKFYQGGKLQKVLNFQTDLEGRLAMHRKKIIVAAPDRGVYAVDPDRMEVTDTANVVPSDFNARFNAFGDQLYLTSEYTTYRFESAGKLVRVDPVPGKYTPVSYFKPTAGGKVYYITQGKSLYSISNGLVRHFDLDLLQNFELRCLFEDSTGDVLLGTNQGLVHFPSTTRGLTRIDDNFIDAKGPLRVRRKVLQGPDSTILLFGTEYNYTATLNGVQGLLSNVQMSSYDAVRVGQYYYVSSEGQGVVRVGVSNGKVDKLVLDGIAEQKSYGLFFDSTGSRLLIGTMGGMVVLDVPSGRHYYLAVGNEPVPVKSFLKDPLTGDFWIAAESGLYRSRNSLLKTEAAKEKNGADFSIRCDELMLLQGKRELWVATVNGVTVVDLGSGLPKYDLPTSIFGNPRVVSIIEGPLGRIWMGTYSGIVAYDPSTGDYIRLEKKNGLMNQEFNYKSAARLENGFLIFGGLNGYDVIDPSQIEFSIGPKKGFINGYHLFSKTDTVFHKGYPDQVPVLNYELESQHLRLYLSSSDLTNAKRYTFEYSIDGSSWIRLGGNAYIDLFWLEYGRHTLQCRAFNQFGTIIEYLPVTINAQIPFYETPWFLWSLTGIAFAFLVLLILAINYRSRSERELKEKISMDLHDEVGTLLTRTLYQSREISDPALRNRLVGSLNEALYSLRVFIHTISKRVLFLQNLMDEVADLLTKSFSYDDFQLEWNFRQDRNYVVSPELYRDLKLIMFELVNNIMKHASASNLKVSAEANDGKLQILVEDDGPATVVPDEGSQGNGLKNIRRRIDRQKGMADVCINPSGHGFRIRIDVPL